MKEKSKNFGRFLGVYMIALTLAVVGACTLTSCDKLVSYPDNYDTANDSVLVAQQVEAIANPVFETVKEVILYRYQADQGAKIDSIFSALTDEQVKNVSTVVINRDGCATKKSIVEEYRANNTVYDNLPTASQSANVSQKVDLSSTDLGNRRDESDVISTSYQYRTDTINGKPVKIQTKKEESYVRQ